MLCSPRNESVKEAFIRMNGGAAVANDFLVAFVEVMMREAHCSAAEIHAFQMEELKFPVGQLPREMVKAVSDALFKCATSELVWRLLAVDGISGTSTEEMTNDMSVLRSTGALHTSIASLFASTRQATTTCLRTVLDAMLVLLILQGKIAWAVKLVLLLLRQDQLCFSRFRGLLVFFYGGARTKVLSRWERVRLVVEAVEKHNCRMELVVQRTGATVPINDLLREAEQLEKEPSTTEKKMEESFCLRVFDPKTPTQPHEVMCHGHRGVVAAVADVAERMKSAGKATKTATKAPLELSTLVRLVFNTLRMREVPERLREAMIASEGWLPVVELRTLMEASIARIGAPLPPEVSGVASFVEDLVAHHDCVARLEVGRCPTGPFAQQRCMRCLYAHECSLDDRRRLWISGIARQSAEELPARGWILARRYFHALKSATTPFVSITRLGFFSIFSAAALRSFWAYNCATATPLDAHVRVEEGGNPCVFMEVDLQALARDVKYIRIFDGRTESNTTIEKWYLFSGYAPCIGASDGMPDVVYDDDDDDWYLNLAVDYLPKVFLTGRVLSLSGVCSEQFLLPDAHFDVAETLGAALPDVPANGRCIKMPVGYRISSAFLPEKWSRRGVHLPENKSELLYYFPRERVEKLFGGTTTTHLPSSDDQAPTPSPYVAPQSQRIDLPSMREKVRAFAENEARIIMDLEVPISSVGHLVLNRAADMSDFRAWVESLGLRLLSEEKNRQCHMESFVVKKLHPSPQRLALVRKHLNLSDRVDRHTLSAAMTPQSVDRCNNYEVLEYIGDAVMELVLQVDNALMWLLLDKRKSAAQTSIVANVVTKIGCNRVLSRLLPELIAEHLDHIHGGTTGVKTRADVMEALIGAVYHSGCGLDGVRHLQRHLFGPLAHAEGEEQDVAAACPYRWEVEAELDQVHAYNMDRLVEDRDVRSFAVVEASAEPSRVHLPHAASSPFPRIQWKSEASHFTTGGAYSYRRIFLLDGQRMLNRIVALHQAQQMTYSNEILTPITQLVFDFDGCSIHSFAVKDIVWRWFRHTFPNCGPMMILNCSGDRKSGDGYKSSYHIHFPQVAISMESYAQIRQSLVSFITSTLRGAYQRCEALRQGPPPQRLLTSLYVERELKKLKGSSAPMKRMWSYCGYEELRELAKTCRGVRQSVLEHIAHLLQHDLQGLWRIFGGGERTTANGTPTSEENVVVDGVYGIFDAPPARAVVRCRTTGRTILLPLEELERSTFLPDTKWEEVVDAGLSGSMKLRMYLCDKYDMVYKEEQRPLHFDSMTFAPHPLVDKPLRLVSVGNRQPPLGPFRSAEAWKMADAMRISPASSLDRTFSAFAGVTDDELMKMMAKDVGKVQPLHGTPPTMDWPLIRSWHGVLSMSSMRCPQYRDVDGRLHHAWNAVCVDEVVGGEKACAANTSLVVRPLEKKVVHDRLAGIHDVLTHCPAWRAMHPPPARSWDVWSNALMLRLAPIKQATKAMEVIPSRAQLPVWWEYMASARQAVLFIAGDPVMVVRGCSSLTEGLAPVAQGGRGGMQRMAQYIIPHLDYTNTEWNYPSLGNIMMLSFGVEQLRQKGVVAPQPPPPTCKPKTQTTPAPLLPQQPKTEVLKARPPAMANPSLATNRAPNAWVKPVERMGYTHIGITYTNLLLDKVEHWREENIDTWLEHLIALLSMDRVDLSQVIFVCASRATCGVLRSEPALCYSTVEEADGVAACRENPNLAGYRRRFAAVVLLCDGPQTQKLHVLDTALALCREKKPAMIYVGSVPSMRYFLAP